MQGYDFSQWEGSEHQKQAMRKVWDISRLYHDLTEHHIQRRKEHSEKTTSLLKEAEESLLRAETSCYFFWGDAWLPKVYDHTEQARHLLMEAERSLQENSCDRA